MIDRRTFASHLFGTVTYRGEPGFLVAGRPVAAWMLDIMGIDPSTDPDVTPFL